MKINIDFYEIIIYNISEHENENEYYEKSEITEQEYKKIQDLFAEFERAQLKIIELYKSRKRKQ